MSLQATSPRIQRNLVAPWLRTAALAPPRRANTERVPSSSSSSSSLETPPKHDVLRCSFSTSSQRRRQYRRFGDPPSTYPPEPDTRTASGSRPSPLAELIRRAAGEQRRAGGGGGGRGDWGQGGSPWTPRWRSSRVPPVILLVVGGGGVYYVVHLETVPYTGRRRFMDLSPEMEQRMGAESYRQVLAQYSDRIYPPRHPVAVRVRQVASRIVAALEAGGLQLSGEVAPTSLGGGGGKSTQWEVFVVEDKQKNAFVLPGGKIFVFSGILDVTRDDDGLATVLGHEVAHQALRHSAEKASSYKTLMFLTLLLELFGLDVGLSRSVLTLAMALPNSRKLESEADRLGLRIMSAACFDPARSVELWRRMDAAEGTRSASGSVLSAAGAIWSTHPLNAQRIEDLQRWMDEAERVREARRCPPAISSQFDAFRLQGTTAAPSFGAEPLASF